MNKILIVIIGLVILLTCFNLSQAQTSKASYSKLLDSSVNATGKISLKLIGDFKLTKQQGTTETAKLEFSSATDFIFIKIKFNVEDSSATKLISDKVFLIENLFKTQPSPYPDLLTNQIYCPDSLKPWAFDSIYPNIKVVAYRLFANERFIYGVYSNDIIIYTSAYILAYNKKEKTLSEIKYFTPRSKPANIPEDVIKSIK